MDKPGGSNNFGNLVSLRPINFGTNTTTTAINTKKCKPPKTRVVRITEQTWQKLKVFSRKEHDQPISYDDIFEELVDFYNIKHEIKYF